MSTKLVDVVASYVEWSRDTKPSRDWQNARCTLARLTLHARTFSPKSIRHALAELERETSLSVRYRRDCWSRWQTFIRWAIEFEHADASVLVRVSTFRPSFREDSSTPKRATPELSEILNDLRRLTPGDRDFARLMLLTAARPSELLNLKSADVRTDSLPYIAVLDQHKTSHLDNHRVIVFGRAAATVLDRHIRPFTPNDWIFPAPKDHERPLTVQTIAQRLRRRKLSWTLYDLRRIAARTVRASAGLDSAQALLGHAKASTTEIYAPIELAKATAAAEILEEELAR